MQWMIRATLVLAAVSWLDSEANACHRCHTATQCRPQCRPVCHRCRRCCCCCTTGVTASTGAAATGTPTVATAAAVGITVGTDGWATVTPPTFGSGGGGGTNTGNTNPTVPSSDQTINDNWDRLATYFNEHPEKKAALTKTPALLERLKAHGLTEG